MQFSKYEALGNDYLVLTPETDRPEAALVRRLCRAHVGVGADGILWPGPTAGDVFPVAIFNPDGSQAGMSGNGARIFARALVDWGLAPAGIPIEIDTGARRVTAWVDAPGGDAVSVDMGVATFASAAIPVAGQPRTVLEETLIVAGETLTICAVGLGNPHCVLVDYPPSAAEIKRLGPLLENHHLFPQRTNVQLLAVEGRRRLRIEVWERGAGYTLASASSACACAAVAHRLGRVDDVVEVSMPGGALEVEIGAGGNIRQRGPVQLLFSGVVHAALLAP